jgi:hypothetical protein
MTGPYHYSKAEEILAEIEATNALSNEVFSARVNPAFVT